MLGTKCSANCGQLRNYIHVLTSFCESNFQLSDAQFQRPFFNIVRLVSGKVQNVLFHLQAPNVTSYSLMDRYQHFGEASRLKILDRSFSTLVSMY
jgi:hypothetical protein